jgi:rhomboid protease GluP
LNTLPESTATRAFQVRFGPEKPSSLNEEWANNLKLTDSGTVEVTGGFVRVTDTRNAAPEERRTFAMDEIANVGYAEGQHIVVLRTRSDPREVYLWMASAADAQALLRLLPRVTTPEFLENLRQHERFRSNLQTLAPSAPVTPAIIGINVVLFLVMLAAGAGLMTLDAQVHVNFGANHGPLTWNGQPWRLITAAFIHFGVIHLAFNMYALHSGGLLTEKLFGSARFAVIYLLAALAGSVVSSWWDASRISAGASGAVFGVYGALLAFITVRRGDIPFDMLKSVGKGALMLCVYSLAMGAIVPFIDNAAHVGGLLGGAVSGLLLARPFNAEARAVARPGQVAAVAAAICAALALLATRIP